MNTSSSPPPPASSSEQSPDALPAADIQRLWAPWRMHYVGGEATEAGCIFCNRLAASDDAESLILARTDTAFVMMNLFPYNTGHVMIVPNAHVASPVMADPSSLAGMTDLAPPVLEALQRVLNPAGFNIGMNVGAVAGAGIAGHLHEHVVPRWEGDANFMPILASTMVLPELIPVTYAKVRVELQRELARRTARSLPPVVAVVLSGDRERILLRQDDSGPSLPRIAVDDTASAVWQVVMKALADFGVNARLINWAGGGFADAAAQPSLLFVAADDEPAPHGIVWQAVGSALDAVLPESDRAIVAAAIAHVRPAVVAPPGTFS